MKRILTLALVLALCLASTAALAEKASVRFGNTQSADNIQSLALTEVANRLSEATNGDFVAQTYFSSSLGDTDDLLEQAMEGAAVLTVSDPSRLQSFVNDYGILGMPYLIDNYDALTKLMETDVYATWLQAFADQGIWLVTSNWASGVRNFDCDKVVNKPEDLAGLRIRTIGNDICTKSVNAMGAVATPMSWSEVYTSIQQKALDGAEVQTTSFYSTRLWEVTKVINHTEHFYLVGSVVTGTGFRDSLSEDYQKLFTDTFAAVGTEYQSIELELSKQYEEEMASTYGTIINTDVDIEAFKAAAAPVYDEMGYADVRDQIYAELGL